MSAIIPALPRLRREHPVADGLVAYYPFYEGSGGLLGDIAGRNLTGTLTNMDPTTDWVASPYGWVLDFDGSNDFVTTLLASDNAAIAGARTFSAWALSNTVASGAGILDYRIACQVAAGSSTRFAIGAGVSAGLKAGLAYNNGSPQILLGTTSLSAGVWYHIAGVYTTSELIIYLNGVEENRVTSTTGASSSAVVEIGRLSAPSRWWNGRIAQVAIHGRALSADEISLLASQPDLLIEPPSTRRIYLFKSATGGAMSGTAALVFASSGTLAGAGELGGVALLTFAASGTATGAGAMSGSAAMAFGASGSATGDADMTGTAALVFSASGNMASGGDMTGSAALTFAASGSLTGGGTLAGGAALVFTASGELSSGALSGSISMVWSASGTMSGCRRYSGCVDTDYNYDSPAATGRRYSGCDAQASDYTYEAS